MIAIDRLRGRDADGVPRPRPASAPLFRYLPGDSPLHHLWAGTKLLVVIGLGITLSLRPTWPTEGIIAAGLLAVMLIGRIPHTVIPRIPRWIWLGLAVSAALALLSGGSPNLHIGHLEIGLGSLETEARFLVFTVLLLLAAALVAWTTPLADVAPAIATLLAPLRLVRFPVDELAVTLALSVRCLPLLIDELRTLWAARRIRTPPEWTARYQLNHWPAIAIDLLVSALVTATRRAREMGEAMDARGGAVRAPTGPHHAGLRDVVAIVLVAGVLTAVMLV
jgi:energy-coupling factor transport system permease protein